MIKPFIIALLTIVVFFNNGFGNEQTTKMEQRKNSNINGEKLFKSMCINCHKCDKEYTGPMLKGTRSRWKNKKAMYKFVREPWVVVDIDKEPYAVKLQRKYKLRKPGFSLTDKEIDAILDYCGQ